MELELYRIAQDLIAIGTRWEKNNSSVSDKPSWKRKKLDGSWEYRYQTSDPNNKRQVKHNLDQDEVDSLESYIDDDMSYSFNMILRGGRKGSQEELRKINWLRDGLSKLPDHKGIVFRGVGLENEKGNAVLSFLHALKPNDVIKSLGFLSCSKGINKAKEYLESGGGTGFLLIIKSETGKDIRPYTEDMGFKDEKEILFKDKCCFKISKITKLTGRFQDSYLLEMEETKEAPTKFPIQNMDEEQIRTALMSRKGLNEKQIMEIANLSPYNLRQIKNVIIKKHGPHFVM